MPIAHSRPGRFRPATSKCIRLAALLTTLMASPALTNETAASQRTILVINTVKPLGPVPGQFSTSGAFADSGIVVTERRIVTAVPSPFGVVTHLVLRFEGEYGTFTIRTQIVERVTADPHVFANEGTWVIVDATGAYETLHGTGEVEGTVDDVANLVTRDYTGLVHFN